MTNIAVSKFRTCALVLGLLTVGTVRSQAAEIWDGPPLTFEKLAFADASLPENQDRIASDIWITRSNTQGLFNAALESSYGNTSPQGTLWAVGTTDDVGSLTFDTWVNTVGMGTPIGGPPNAVGVDMVLQLVDLDVLLDIKMLEWGQGSGSGGGFRYQRSSAPVPEPSAIGLLAVAAGALVGLRRLA